MYKIIDKTGQSYDDISRQLYGTPDRAGDLAKINNNTDGEIIVFDDDSLNADGDGIRVNIDGTIYNKFNDAPLYDSINKVRAGIFVFEIAGQNFRIGQNASIYTDIGLFLNGNIKNIIPILDNKVPKVQVEIKSSAGILIDSVVPFPLESHNVSLRTIITNVCNYYGISVSFADDSRLDLITKSEIDNSFAAHLQEKAWDYLVRIVSSRGMLLQDTGNGVYVGIIESQKPVISFIEGQTIGVTSWEPIFNTEDLARYYEAHSQYPVSSVGMAQIPFNLPITKRVIKEDATDGGMDDYARWFACGAIGDAFKVLLQIHDNLKLSAGDFAFLQSKTCFFEEETEMIIEDIEYVYPVGMLVLLTLPCTYTGIIPDSLPLC